VLVLLLV